ncbi:MAG: metal-dependent transcriptional regulator [Bacteroidales bacterium]|nr:metal-dependent transcriptional regulator [Bacteroidales bacterium]
MTFAEQDYIKAIFQLEEERNNTILTNDLAARLGTKASSVTDMFKKLEKKNLIIYKKYQGVKLNEEGRKAALKLIRKHRLWETFLVKSLGFGWESVHEIAEQLEHIESDELIERLNQFLGYPAFDPHGEPIPLEKGKVWEAKSQKLSEVEPGNEYILDSVVQPNDEFLKYLNKINLLIGTKFRINSKESYDDSLQIQIEDQIHVLSKDTTNNLKVRKHGA